MFMKKQIGSLVLACVAAIAFAGCATSHHTTAWDYKIVEGNNASAIEAQLSKLSTDGWIVVSSSSSAHEGTSPDIVVILKHHR
jgi:hypothetical protein